MPIQDQLEVIMPSGEVKFYDLDPAKGITNIGRHPDNDIVIDSPSVAPFHAILDHQQRPYQFMVLSREGTATLGGQPLSPNVFQEIHNWDTVEIDGYAIILLEGEGVVLPPPPKVPLVGAPVPLPETTAVAPTPQIPVGPATFADQADDIILTEISARELIIDVEQSATAQVTVINGGNIVATFDVRVEGVDESWVVVSPLQVNLYEGARATVTISLTAPRLPTSSAGLHPLAVVVTSPNYPGHASRTGVTLTVNPYYEFAVGELSPKQQNVSWRRRSGEAVLPIANKGNSETAFRLEGDDDERACRFEFKVRGEEATLVRQAELRLRPGESLSVPVHITPIRRRLVALRKRNYSFTVTTSMAEGGQMPRSVMGQLKSAPLIGPWLIVLMLLCLAAVVVFLFRPHPEPAIGANITATSRPNETVTLNYDASRFDNLGSAHILNRLNAIFLRLTLEYRIRDGQWQTLKSPSELDKPDGTEDHIPPDNIKYRVRADTWLSQLVPMLAGTSREIPVYVTPVEPQIVRFASDKSTILEGQTVTLFWQVLDAETLTLAHKDIEETLKDTELESGQRSFTLEQDTTFTLIADNSSWDTPVKQPLPIKVLFPTATPVPTPVILRFDVNPLTITLGESVRINWEVSGADSVSVSNLGAGLPLKGDVGHQPAALTNYQLTAYKSAPVGTPVENKSLLQEVVVNLPPTPTPTLTPTPTPAPPEIQLFEATPKEVILGDDQVVRLSWSVTGKTTNIEITAPDLKLSGLMAQDIVDVTVGETTLFILTAYNGELSRSTPVEVTVIEPTPTVTLTPTATPTETPTSTPTSTPTLTPTPTPIPPSIVLFRAIESDPPTGEVEFEHQIEGTSGPIYVYTVDAGADVVLEWDVNNAEIVTLNLETQKPFDTKTLSLAEILDEDIYELKAEKAGLDPVYAYIKIELRVPPPPPPPDALEGREYHTPTIRIELEWYYDEDYEDDITAFRVYRADISDGRFFVVSNDSDLQVEAPPTRGHWSWTDDENAIIPLTEMCDKAYYVVAVYEDIITGDLLETAASTTSWYSQPCDE